MSFVKYQNTNNASSLLIADITASQTTILITDGDQSLFPSSFPFLLTLEHLDASENVILREIVKAVSGNQNSFTVERSAGICVQDDTATNRVQDNTAHAFYSGDRISLYWTAEQVADIQNNLEAKGNQDAIANVYDNTATYEVGDIVVYKGSRYVCQTAVETAEEFDSSKWIKVNIQYDLDEQDARITALENVGPSTMQVDVLLVGGGGGGGGGSRTSSSDMVLSGGGGGAGGVKFLEGVIVNNKSLNVVVGAGGAGGANGNNCGTKGGNGCGSSFGPFYVLGGGGGGNGSAVDGGTGRNGGSGGGMGGTQYTSAFCTSGICIGCGDGITGNPGSFAGNRAGCMGMGGGGGGAGERGGSANISPYVRGGSFCDFEGIGGRGIFTCFGGTNICIGGGGSGGLTTVANLCNGQNVFNNPERQKASIISFSGMGYGGGEGASYINDCGANGCPNTGGGGGGGTYCYSNRKGGNGGSGLVIVRYPKDCSYGIACATGGTITTPTINGIQYVVHTFTSSGTFCITQTA